jgi:hypothetical protein
MMNGQQSSLTGRAAHLPLAAIQGSATRGKASSGTPSALGAICAWLAADKFFS